MDERDFSLDDLLLADRQSSYVFRIKSKISRLGLKNGDLVIVDRSLPLKVNQIALIWQKGKLRLETVTPEILASHDPLNGDFIWGMARGAIKELE